MVSEYLKHVRSLEELYDIFDRDRVAAARIAEAVFNTEVGTAIASISEVSQVVGAKVLAGSQVAAAKMLIDAEVAATRLLADAEMTATELARRVRAAEAQEFVEVVHDMILEIGRMSAEKLSESAKDAIAAIERDASEAIARLKDSGVEAIKAIQSLADGISRKTAADAEEAAARLGTFRQHQRSLEEVKSEKNVAAQIIVAAAEASSATLRQAVEAAFARINAITTEAIHAASMMAGRRIEEARLKALARIAAVAEGLR